MVTLFINPVCIFSLINCLGCLCVSRWEDSPAELPRHCRATHGHKQRGESRHLEFVHIACKEHVFIAGKACLKKTNIRCRIESNKIMLEFTAGSILHNLQYLQFFLSVI